MVEVEEEKEEEEEEEEGTKTTVWASYPKETASCYGLHLVRLHT